MQDRELVKALSEATGFEYEYPQIVSFYFANEGYHSAWMEGVRSLLPELNLPYQITDNGVIVMVYVDISSPEKSETTFQNETIPLSYMLQMPLLPSCFIDVMTDIYEINKTQSLV